MFDQATCNLRALQGAYDVTFPQPLRTHMQSRGNNEDVGEL